MIPPALLAIYLALGFLIFRSAWHQPGAVTLGTTGDTRFMMWFLGWAPFALGHGHNPFLSNYIDWPGGINLMWNTSILLPATLLAPLTSALGPVFSYNFMTTVAPGLSAFAAFLLIRRFVPHDLPAAIGGLVYGFSPFMIAQSLGHTVLTIVALPPLIFLMLDNIVRLRRAPALSGIALGALCAAQLLITEEFLATTAMVALIALIILAAEHWNEVRSLLPQLVRPAAFATGTFLLLAGYPLAVQFLGRQRVSGSLHPPNLFANDVLGFVVPGRYQLLAPRSAVALSDQFIAAHTLENGAYIGIPLLLLLGYIAVRFWGDPRVRLATLTAVVLAILSLGYTLHFAAHTSTVPVLLLALVFPALQRFLPGRVLLYMTAAGWLILVRAPLLREVLPSRLSVFIFLFVGLLLAVFLERLPGLIGWRRPAAVLAMVIALVPLLPALHLPLRNSTVPAFFHGEGLTAIPQGSVVLVAPFPGIHHEEPMLWQATARMRYRMPGGYAFTPHPYIQPMNPPPSFTLKLLWAIEAGTHDGSLSADERTQLEAELDSWRIRFIIVGPMDHEDQAVALFTGLLGQGGTPTGGVYLWSR